MTSYRKFKGFTLIELMIAMAIGLFLTLVVVVSFSQVSRSQQQDEQITLISENGRYALRALSRSLTLGGFYGGVSEVSGISIDGSVAVGSNCEAGAIAVSAPSVSIVNDATAVQAGNYDCLDTTDFVAGTDVLRVLRVADAPTAAPTPAGIYVATNSFSGVMYSGALPASVVPPIQNWRFMPEVFYVINEANAAGVDVPTLCRYTLSETTGVMGRRCLADGIENIQIEFGVDANNDFVADYYNNDPTAVELANAISARIYILVRGDAQITGYVNDKVYALGSTNIPAFNDGYLRRVFSTTVELKNSDRLSVVPFTPS